MNPSAGAHTPLGRAWSRYLPVAITCAGAAVAGMRGMTDPLTWLVLGPGAAWLLVQLFTVIPVAPFWLVPLSTCWFTYFPIMHYEALVLLLGAMMLLVALRSGALRRVSLQPVEWHYALFLLAWLPGLPAAVSLWRFGGAVKLYVVGLAAFAVARHAARRYGRTVMLVGPIAFVLVTAVQLGFLFLQSGVPAFKSNTFRFRLATLSWGTTNYVAAMLVLCLPAFVLLGQDAPPRSRRRLFAFVGLGATLACMFFTLSRGGVVLCLLYLLSLTRFARRGRWPLLTGLGGLLALIAFTPLGQVVLTRFTDVKSFDSVLTRARYWMAAWERAVHHLPFGVGAGQGWLQTDALASMDPHDFPLTLLGEGGPLVLVAWFWVIAALWGAGRRLARDPATHNVGTALGATIVLAVVNSLWEPTLIGNQYHLMFWWLAGIYHGTGAPADLPAERRAPAGLAEGKPAPV